MGEYKTGEHSEKTQGLHPKELSSRHRAAMRMKVAGHTLNDIAQELGFNVQRLSVVMNSPMFKEEMERLEKDVRREFVEAEGKKLAMDPTDRVLRGATEKAARTLEGALDERDHPQVRVSAAKDILDRGGYVKEEKVRARVLVEPSESLLNMLERTGKKGAGDK